MFNWAYRGKLCYHLLNCLWVVHTINVLLSASGMLLTLWQSVRRLFALFHIFRDLGIQFNYWVPAPNSQVWCRSVCANVGSSYSIQPLSMKVFLPYVHGKSSYFTLCCHYVMCNMSLQIFSSLFSLGTVLSTEKETKYLLHGCKPKYGLGEFICVLTIKD